MMIVILLIKRLMLTQHNCLVLQLSPSQSQATQLHVGRTVIESQVSNSQTQSGDLAGAISELQSQAAQLGCTVIDSQISIAQTRSEDLAKPIPEPVYNTPLLIHYNLYPHILLVLIPVDLFNLTH